MVVDLIKRLQAENPREDVVSIAIRTLNTQQQIEEFLRQYAEHITPALNEEGEKDPPHKVARNIIDGILNHSHQRYVEVWKRALKVADAYPRDFSTSA